MLNVVETFSGIGSQTQALTNLKIEHKVSATAEWEIGAMYAYDIMHHGPQNFYSYRHHSRESLVQKLSQYTLSSNGKEALTYQALNSMTMTQLKGILCAIERSNNLVDITQVHAIDLDDDIDVLTYSFPCQDLSVSSHWWHNSSGIEKGSGNRSSLLWEIERILSEFKDIKKPLPKFLLMENVSAILNQQHVKNFDKWRKFLSDAGYINKTYTLNAVNFAMPQNRERTYLLSVLAEDYGDTEKIEAFFEEHDLEKIRTNSKKLNIGKYLRLDYSQQKYYEEAIESTPNFTPSREKIYENNVWLATDNKPLKGAVARTITTKQDRHPNSGLITYSESNELLSGRKYRNITAREAFLLMGFKEEQYDLLMKQNVAIASDRSMISSSKMLKLAGNSIVVNVLEALFSQVMQIREVLSEKNEDNDISDDLVSTRDGLAI